MHSPRPLTKLSRPRLRGIMLALAVTATSTLALAQTTEPATRDTTATPAAVAPITTSAPAPTTVPTIESPLAQEPLGRSASAAGPAVSPFPAHYLDDPAHLPEFYDKTRTALVAVSYQWAGELQRQEVIGAGVVVREDGLVMLPMLIVAEQIPAVQMKDFKILIPSDTGDPEEVPATFYGRDPRSEVAFVKANDTQRKWTPLRFDDDPLQVGQKVWGLGLMPKAAGYKAFLAQAIVAAHLRGEQPTTLVSGGGLASVGSPVFDDAGRAVGLVMPQEGQPPLLDTGNELIGILTPPRFFVPTAFLAQSLTDPPTPQHPLRISWSGIVQMTGVPQQVADFLGLKNQPAAQVGDVVPGSAAAQAGLHRGDIITQLDGKPLERGDLPEEIPQILRRTIMRRPVGSKLTLTLLGQNGQPSRQAELTLQERPKSPSDAPRYFASDLGFVVREGVFQDFYLHKIRTPAQGVVVDLLKQDGAAATAKLAPQDLLISLNGKPVTSLAQFKTDYAAARQNHPSDPVVLLVNRMGGREETINIEPPQGEPAPDQTPFPTGPSQP